MSESLATGLKLFCNLSCFVCVFSPVNLNDVMPFQANLHFGENTSPWELLSDH